LTSKEARRSWRVAVLLFVSLFAHNFPEGFAVAATSVHSPKLGVTTALAIAFHNIPEGIAIAIPCLAARPDSPWLAFGLASLSGLAEPLGAAVALLILRGGPSGASTALDIDSVLSFVAGVMITVALNELFPEAMRHSEDGKVPLWLGVIAGAVVMLASDAILDANY
jgi:ZIP family zinc transporter